MSFWFDVSTIACGRIYTILAEEAERDEYYLGCFSAETGELLWKTRTSGVLDWPCAIASGMVYLCGDSVVALDALTGDLVSRSSVTIVEPSAPAVAGGKVYVSVVDEYGEEKVFCLGETGVSIEDFRVLNGTDEFDVKLYLGKEGSDLLDVFYSPISPDVYPGLTFPFEPDRSQLVKKVTVCKGGREIQDEQKLSLVLRALSGWVLAKYTIENPVDGCKSGFEILNEASKSEDAPEGLLINVINSKSTALDLARYVTCPSSLFGFGFWKDAVTTSVERSFSAGGCPPGFEEHAEEIEKRVNEIVQGINTYGVSGEVVKEVVRTFVKALVLRTNGVKTLSFLREYAEENGVNLDPSFKEGLNEVIATYGVDNYDEIFTFTLAIRKGVEKALEEASKKMCEEIINKALSNVVEFLKMKISEQAASAFSSVVSGVAWGYLIADLTMNPCENFRLINSHIASMYVAREYGRIEKALMEDIASSKEINLTKAYAFITLRKMELSAIGQSYEVLSKIGDVSLLNKLIVSVGVPLGYTASKKEILNAADMYLYPARRTEIVTQFFVTRALGKEDYEIHPFDINRESFQGRDEESSNHNQAYCYC